MTWTTETWDAFCGLIEEAWPGTFDDNAAASWRVLLDNIAPVDAVAAMRRLLFAGQRFRPSASELLAELRADPSAPTFEEAYRLIFGAGGILTAQPTVRRWKDEGERRRLCNDAAVARAGELHPLVGSFVARQGIDRLRALPVDDLDFGELRRKELQAAWDRHVEASDGREVAALASGDASPKGLRRFDPLVALGIGKPTEIEAGEAA